MADATPSESPFGAAFRAEETPRLDGYQLLDILGAGGHSTVYLAQDAVGRRVAVKHWKGARWEPDVRARLEREVEILRGLNHPNLVEFLGVAEDEAGDPSIVMAAIEGESLAARIAEEGRLSPPAARAIALELCGALEYVAAQGLVHRDVKPANVVLRPDGRPVLVDFSVAKQVDPSAEAAQLTRTGAAVGTSAYMAPEQCAGDLGPVDARTDVYGLGALLFQALCGLPPWSHESGWERTQRNPWHQPYPAQPEERARVEAAQARVPESLARTVARCLEGDPRKRFPDATTLAAALQTSPPRRSLPLGIAALFLFAVVSYGFFHHASRLVPNHGQTQEESMKTPATIAVLATLMTPAADAQTPAPRPQKTPTVAPVTSTGIGPTFVRALRTQDLTLFQTLLQPRRPRDRKQALDRFPDLTARLAEAGPLEQLRFVRVLDDDAKPLGSSRLAKTNLHIEVALGAKRVWVELQDAVPTPAGWRVTESLSPRWRDEPRTRRGSIYPTAASLDPVQLDPRRVKGLRYLRHESGPVRLKSRYSSDDGWGARCFPTYRSVENRRQTFRHADGTLVVVWQLRFARVRTARSAFERKSRKGPADEPELNVDFQPVSLLRTSNVVCLIEASPANAKPQAGETRKARDERLAAWAATQRKRLAPFVALVRETLGQAIDAPLHQRVHEPW